MDEPALWLGTVLCAGLAAAALLPLPRQHRVALLTAALLVAPALIAADNWQGDQLSELRDSPVRLAVAALLAAGAIGLLTAAFVRWPRILPLALIAVLPIRIPIELAGSTSNLLVPLYGVLVAALVAAWVRPEAVLPRSLPARGPGALVGWALAAVLAVYALQAGYADDISAAVKNVAFFFAPFAALFVFLAAAGWDRGLLRAAVAVITLEALVFALVGFGQYASGELFWNEKVIAGNEAHAWFRVNSLFYDPNIMARYLAVTMIVLAAIVAWAPRRYSLRSAALFAVLLVALTITFSQSGLLSLLAGVLVLVLARWGALRALAAAAVVAALLAVAVLVSGVGGLSAETSGRTGLARGGLELAKERPLTGYGAGSFPDEFKERFGRDGAGFAVVSHTEPITVAAEQGVIGLVPYATLVLLSLGALWVGAGIGWGPSANPVAAALLAAFVAMVVHSLGYAAFLTDPITWVILALAVPLPVAARAGALALSAEPEAT
jgi:putative inorganic carbon (HCO3(-)) transporter